MLHSCNWPKFLLSARCCQSLLLSLSLVLFWGRVSLWYPDWYLALGLKINSFFSLLRFKTEDGHHCTGPLWSLVDSFSIPASMLQMWLLRTLSGHSSCFVLSLPVHFGGYHGFSSRSVFMLPDEVSPVILLPFLSPLGRLGGISVSTWPFFFLQPPYQLVAHHSLPRALWPWLAQPSPSTPSNCSSILLFLRHFSNLLSHHAIALSRGSFLCVCNASLIFLFLKFFTHQDLRL